MGNDHIRAISAALFLMPRLGFLRSKLLFLSIVLYLSSLDIHIVNSPIHLRPHTARKDTYIDKQWHLSLRLLHLGRL